MAKRSFDDDFIRTISDNEDEDLFREEKLEVEERPRKKSKKAKQPEPKPTVDDGDDFNSDFEFFDDEAAGMTGDLDGWDFKGAKEGMSEKRNVDLDDIIKRRKKGGKDQDDEDEEEAEELDLDDDEDGVLADDAFGMNVDPGDDEGSEDEEAGSDDDSVAAPVAHPDDDASEGSDEEDADEEAKRKAFFAPEEEQKGPKKSSAGAFMGMALSRPILRGLNSVGFSTPTPIQAKTIPLALQGKDLVGGAVTGSGKTAAFLVPILERLLWRPSKVPRTRVVVLTPTRELAMQCHAVAVKLASFTDIKFTLSVGGLSLKAQQAELRRRPDVVIATPGRFIDHMRNSASFETETVEILVLDEADRMLEDGFADELDEILKTLPKSRQTMLFSATMTSSVDRLIRVGLTKPVRLMVDSQKKTVGTLTQEFVRLRPGREGKRMGYLLYLCKNLYTQRVIIFFRSKKEAHHARVVFALLGLSSAELHGSINQAQRIASVEAFRDGKVNFLLATDLASRGLDIKGVDTVINYEAPQSLEIYVHRVGRTARAGRSGVACTIAAEPDRKVVRAAVKAGNKQGAKIASRMINPADADEWQDKVEAMKDEIEEVEQELKEEKQLANAEMQVTKGENLITHEAEILARPRRTWFESEKDKRVAKKKGREELNGKDVKKPSKRKMSNKERKKTEAKEIRGKWKRK